MREESGREVGGDDGKEAAGKSKQCWRTEAKMLDDSSKGAPGEQYSSTVVQRERSSASGVVTRAWSRGRGQKGVVRRGQTGPGESVSRSNRSRRARPGTGAPG
eukprot:1694746-Rhodomonas_salina.6